MKRSKPIVTAGALQALSQAQAHLPDDIRLFIKRGYEPETWFKKGQRRLGAKLFCLLYPWRKNEAFDLFGHNGHATNGNHVDIGVCYKGKRLDLLTFNVFTPLWMIDCKIAKYALVLDVVGAALVAAGFVIHHNKTEALQIHCDFNQPPSSL